MVRGAWRRAAQDITVEPRIGDVVGYVWRSMGSLVWREGQGGRR